MKMAMEGWKIGFPAHFIGEKNCFIYNLCKDIDC